jgi:hypothetical protein
MKWSSLHGLCSGSFATKGGLNTHQVKISNATHGFCRIRNEIFIEALVYFYNFS